MSETIRAVALTYMAVGLFVMAVALYCDRPRFNWRWFVAIPLGILFWPGLVVEAVRRTFPR